MNIVADLGLLLMTTQKDEEQIKQYSSKIPNCSCVELLLLKTLTTFSIKMPAFNSFNRLSEKNIINKFLLSIFFTVTFLFLLFYIGNNMKDIDQNSSLLH